MTFVTFEAFNFFVVYTRELVSDLFALYKTRIWMQQIDASFNPNVNAARALSNGSEYIAHSNIKINDNVNINCNNATNDDYSFNESQSSYNTFQIGRRNDEHEDSANNFDLRHLRIHHNSPPSDDDPKVNWY